MARFLQNFSRLSVPPNNVVKIVESASKEVPGALVFRRHPDQGVELLVACRSERVRAVQVNWLTRQDANGFFVIRGQCVVRQMGMEVEGGDTVEQAKFVPGLC